MRHLFTDTAIWVAVLGFVLGMLDFVVRRRAADRSVNKAVFAEMHRVLEAVRSHKEFWEGCIDKGTTSHHPLIPFAHHVYDSQIKDVGVIKRRRVEDVVRFFGYIDYVNCFQALRPEYAGAGREEEFNKMYLTLLTRLLDRHS